MEGDQVSESQLQLLVGMGRNPVTGDPLGLAYPAYKTVAERIEERTAALDPGLGPASRAEAVAQIEAEEAGRGTRRAVAGFLRGNHPDGNPWAEVLDIAEGGVGAHAATVGRGWQRPR